MMMVYTLTLNPQDVVLIGTGLRELPYRVSAELIGRLQVECARQEHEAAAKAAKMQETSSDAEAA